MSQFLLLVTSDHRTGQTTVAVPRASLGTRVTTRHPAEELAVVDNEVRERELVRVEHERRDAQRQHRDPEVDEEGRPDGHGGVEKQKQVAHTHIDTGSSETRVEDSERDTSRRETTTRRNVSGTTKCQVALDRLRVDLRGEDFEDGRERQEVLCETDKGTSRSSLDEFWKRCQS